MKRNLRSLGAGLEWCGALCVVAVSLPFLALAIFLLRGLMLVAAITGIVAAAFLYRLNPRFHVWLDHQMGLHRTTLAHGPHGRVRH